MSEVTTSDQLLENYKDYYKEGDSEWRRLGALGKADNIVSLCSALPQNSVLEVGAGEGSILMRLSEINFGRELYALEISQSGVETITNKKIPRLAECRIFNGYQIPFEADQFDIAILSHVVEHVEHPRLLLYEAARVARYVFVEVPLEDTIWLTPEFVFDKVGHINFYSPKTIRRLVQSCNLHVLRQITVNPPKEAYRFRKGTKGLASYYIKQSLLGALSDRASGFFTYHGALVCEKGTVPQAGAAPSRPR